MESSGFDLSFRLQKQPQHLEWLVLNRHTHTGAEQFNAAQINMERIKSCTRPTVGTVCSQLKPQPSHGKCTSISRGTGKFGRFLLPLTAALLHIWAVHHQFTPRFTLGALRALASDAMLQPDAGIRSRSGVKI